MNDADVPMPPKDSQSIKSYAAPLFLLGSTVATPGALALLERHGVSAASLLKRHQYGDWGDLTAQDGSANEIAIKDGSRILSAYEVGRERLWVITEAEDDRGTRASTCVLLVAEY